MTAWTDEQLRMALDPVDDRWELRPGLRPAAVLAPLWRVRDGVDSLLLTKRPDALRSHPGQVSFPGGRRDGGETPVECALRESAEEIGLAASAVRVLGMLPPRVSVAGFFVHVVVGRIVAVDFAPMPDPAEVERVYVVPVAEIAASDRWEWVVPRGGRRAMPHFELEGGAPLWGLTARFTHDLLSRLGIEPLGGGAPPQGEDQ